MYKCCCQLNCLTMNACEQVLFYLRFEGTTRAIAQRYTPKSQTIKEERLKFALESGAGLLSPFYMILRLRGTCARVKQSSTTSNAPVQNQPNY